MAEIAVLHLGEGAASAIIKLLLEKLSSPVFRRLGFLFKVEEKLKSLEEESLPQIYSLVHHAEMLYFRDPALVTWLTKVKGVACDAEDVLDDFAVKSQSRYDIGEKIDGIQKRFAGIANEGRDRGWAYPPSQFQIQSSERRATSSLPTERYVFGRDPDRESLVRLLLGHQESGHHACPFSVLPIVGMGGLGKTTLAREVFNDSRMERHFNLRIWVCVSNDLNVRRITEEILAGASDDKFSGNSNASLGTLQSDLRWKLSTKRFLLVLDDVWSEDRQDWETLRAPLKFGEEGSKVVITTRSRKVADIMGTADSLFLDCLTELDCWYLFKSCAFFKGDCNDFPRLAEIGRRIVRRLNGVPLAAKTIGGLLYSNLDEGAWTAVLDSEMWKLMQSENDIMPVLRLSYQQMAAHLKRCFKFCSLFPKDYRFYKDRLVLLWMAQGFVQPQGRRRMEDIGGEHFDDLVSRSFFQKVGDHYLMHDLMHDLAQSISTDECVYIDDKKQETPEKVLHLLVHPDLSVEFKDLYKLKRLRTLVYVEKYSIPKKLFKRLKYLRVLDLSMSGIEELPDSVGLLKHLRYLDLSITRIRRLPEAVGDLCNLQTMRLKSCYYIAALPRSMNKLTKLRHLEGRAVLLSKVAGIGNLVALQRLNEFEVSRETGFNVGELKDLTELRGELHISGLENVLSGEEANEASLTNKQYLHTLRLEWGDNGVADMEVLECLKPHPNLKALYIEYNDGAECPSWLTEKHLPSLEEVSLLSCRIWKVLPPLGQLSLLKRLRIGAMAGVEKLGPEFWGDKGFPLLEVLAINGMNEWDGCVGVDRRELFPSLRRLDISDCPNLRVLPALPPTLEVLEISKVGLSALPRLWGCNEASSSLSASSSSLSPSSALSSLSISDCPELTSLKEGLLQQHHHALCKLRIRNCEEVVDLPTQGLSNLISLQTLDIIKCPNLTSLPEGLSLPSSLQTLHINGSHYLLVQLHNLTSLFSLSISTSPSLISLSGEVLRNLTTLKYLTVESCEALSTLGIQALTALKGLRVGSCPMLTSLTDSREGLQRLVHLKKITIYDCASFNSLPAELHRLFSLQELRIADCPRIRSLPDLTTLNMLIVERCKKLSTLGIQARTFLNGDLRITSCPKLISLSGSSEGLQRVRICDCALFDSLPYLSSLLELEIMDCPRIHSLPDLPDSLRKLYIENCPELARQYQQGSSGWQTIARIQNINII